MIVCVILARGGSKGIPRKNLLSFAGKPLLSWTISQAKKAKKIDRVFVSTEDDEISRVAFSCGADIVKRPQEYATDTSSTELALLHALGQIESSSQEKIDYIVFLQATSPLRLPEDIDSAIETIIAQGADSLFSGAQLNDFLVWEKKNNNLRSLNYDYTSRPRRQDIDQTYVENGSIYIFKPQILIDFNNRLGGKIAIYPMKFWQSFEIDDIEGAKLCEWLFQEHIGGV